MNKLDFATYEELAAPAVKINEIALSYTEKLLEMNLAVMPNQAAWRITTWPSPMATKPPTATQDYLSAQGEAARELVEGYVADAKAVSAISQEAANDVRKVVTEGLEKAAKQAA